MFLRSVGVPRVVGTEAVPVRSKCRQFAAVLSVAVLSAAWQFAAVLSAAVILMEQPLNDASSAWYAGTA